MRIVSFAAALLLTVAAAAQPLDTRAVDRLMTDAMRAWNAPGAAVAIVQNDRVVYVKGYGVKELGGGPVTPDTLFQIASTSKAFTTTAMAMLADEKKLSWDDPVRKHVAYFRLSDPCAESQVTLRDIVSHRTGLSRHDVLWDDTPLTREEVIRGMAFVRLSRPFRTTYQYQNIMFITAGEAVTAAAGMPWEDFFRTRIFEPLGMRNTVAHEEGISTVANRAYGHSRNGAGWKRTDQSLTSAVLGDGGIYSSIDDLARWAGALDEWPLLAPAFAPATPTDEPNVDHYGFGWRVTTRDGRRVLWHSGETRGFRNVIVRLPEERTTVVILTNRNEGELFEQALAMTR